MKLCTAQSEPNIAPETQSQGQLMLVDECIGCLLLLLL